MVLLSKHGCKMYYSMFATLSLIHKQTSKDFVTTFFCKISPMGRKTRANLLITETTTYCKNKKHLCNIIGLSLTIHGSWLLVEFVNKRQKSLAITGVVRYMTYLSEIITVTSRVLTHLSRVSNIESDNSQNVGLEDYNNLSD